MERTQQILEIKLEELEEPFWRAALANSLTGAFGSVRYRFAGRVSSATGDGQDVVGSEFSMMRFQDLDDVSGSDPAMKPVREQLQELDNALRAAGWERLPTLGRHWWSFRYTKA